MKFFGFSLKRFWKRKKYQRLEDATLRDNNRKRHIHLKMKHAPIVRIFGANSNLIRLQCGYGTPDRKLNKSFVAYINAMICLAGSKKCNIYKVPMVSSSYRKNTVDDNRLILEFYKGMASARLLACPLLA